MIFLLSELTNPIWAVVWRTRAWGRRQSRKWNVCVTFGKLILFGQRVGMAYKLKYNICHHFQRYNECIHEFKISIYMRMIEKHYSNVVLMDFFFSSLILSLFFSSYFKSIKNSLLVSNIYITFSSEEHFTSFFFVNPNIGKSITHMNSSFLSS